ncbi:hypothetical protein CAPTEDRAFT_186739 [Capitella teleta]|uniref:SOCS box domain-containing protein n=1 Tax=Capitella teleta TaxID=283909 RepID=R7UH19_CAPTE|nr:hypothetical protein CAPTEDRAFT_186739 [Capitella teleta]|eukprot:ELU05839.1 hypothetical protein CAPTEDRAFT_186739 [Capitella teleta]
MSVWRDLPSGTYEAQLPKIMPIRPRTRCNIHDLHYIIQVGEAVKVKSVLDSDKTELDINSTVGGSTALSLALNKEKPDTVSLLLSHPSTSSLLDVNKLSKDNKQRVEPPLVTACRLEDLESARLLLNRPEINVEGKDIYGHTALWMATRQRCTDLVELLIKHGASVNPSYKWSHSPLFFATKYSSRRTDIARRLLLHGASVHLTSDSPSLFFCAIMQGNLNMAKLIAEAGYNITKDKTIKKECNISMLTRSLDFIEWLQDELSSPPSLQRQCRTVIRMSIMKGNGRLCFIKSINELPLPSKIFDFITLKSLPYMKMA